MGLNNWEEVMRDAMLLSASGRTYGDERIALWLVGVSGSGKSSVLSQFSLRDILTRLGLRTKGWGHTVDSAILNGASNRDHHPGWQKAVQFGHSQPDPCYFKEAYNDKIFKAMDKALKKLQLAVASTVLGTDLMISLSLFPDTWRNNLKRHLGTASPTICWPTC